MPQYDVEYPIPGETVVADHSQTIDLDNVSLEGGKVLVKALSISVDPYLRGKMRHANKKSYNVRCLLLLQILQLTDWLETL